MQLSYINANKDDIENIFNFAKELVNTYEDLSKIDYDKVMAWVKRKIETNINEYNVIMYDGEKVGYYKETYCEDEAKIEIDDLYIFQEYRNKGIGSEIFKMILNRAQKPVFLYVFVKNYRAINLYFRMGFKITEVVHDTRYVMEYTI